MNSTPARHYAITALKSLNDAARFEGYAGPHQASAMIAGIVVTVEYRTRKGQANPARFCTANGTRIAWDKLTRICISAAEEATLDDAAASALAPAALATEAAAALDARAEHAAVSGYTPTAADRQQAAALAETYAETIAALAAARK